MLALIFAVVLACACDVARTGPDRAPCDEFVALLRRCGGNDVATRGRASLEMALADPARAEKTAAMCGVQRDRLARACR